MTAKRPSAGPIISPVDLQPAGPGSEPQAAIRDLAYLSGGSGASITIFEQRHPLA